MRALILAFAAASCAAPAFTCDPAAAPPALTERDILCGGPEGAPIDDDDPGLALFDRGDLQDRKVALAIERTNSCDDGDRQHAVGKRKARETRRAR